MTEKQFLQAINTHKGIIIKVTKIYFDDSLDQEDLFQEIILQLWKSLPSFKGKSKFSSWIYRVAINTAIVYFKKDRKKPKSSQIQAVEELFVQDLSSEKEDQLAHFYLAVKALNKIEKALIFLFIEGFSGEEIAKSLGLSHANTRVKLNRTKQKLQAIIKSQGYEF